MIVPGCCFYLFNSLSVTACKLYDRTIFYNGVETYTDNCSWVAPGITEPTLVCSTYISDLYPLYFEDSMTASVAYVDGYMFSGLAENLDANCSIVSGVLTTTTSYSSYSLWPKEDLDASATIVSGVLTTTTSYGSYSLWPNESLDASAAIISGEMNVTAGYITYSNYLSENLDASCAIVSGVLT